MNNATTKTQISEMLNHSEVVRAIMTNKKIADKLAKNKVTCRAIIHNLENRIPDALALTEIVTAKLQQVNFKFSAVTYNAIFHYISDVQDAVQDYYNCDAEV